MKIGVIGLGRMGRPMAERLLAAGHDVTVHNRSRGPVDALAALGAHPASGAGEVAASASLVITMLPDPATVEAVVLGELAGSGVRVVDMSTSPPALAIRIHEALGSAVDAPVSGGVTGAREGTLSIMAGGSEADVAHARPVLEALGSRITHVGGPGAGQIAKAANQLVVALNIQAVAEALSLASAAGVDPAVVRDALRGGFADSRVLEEHGARMLAEDFAPGGALRTHLKDLRIVLDLAEGCDLELPAAVQVAAAIERLVEAGDGDLDHSALMRGYRW